LGSALQQVERDGIGWPRQRIAEGQRRHENIRDCDRGWKLALMV
jgi:hypothetical protein